MTDQAPELLPTDPDIKYASDIADWCQRSLDEARRTGHLETRPFVQNVGLIIRALRTFARTVPRPQEMLDTYEREFVSTMSDFGLRSQSKTIKVMFAKLRESLTRPTPAERPVPQVREALKRAHQNCLALWEALEGGPSPRCRDCADFNGRCQGNGLPCDPQERALERIKLLRARPSDAAVAWNFGRVLDLAQEGLARWKDKPHNARWWRKIDGTPIPNDLLVNIAEVIAESLRALPPDGPAREKETL